MKNIYKIVFILTCIFSIGNTFAQVPVTDSICRGEQVCVYIPSSPRGTISYESSFDLTTWTPMAGSNDSLCFTMPTTNIYVRAILTEGTCDPVITDTLLFVNIKYQRQVTFNFTGGIQTFTIPADACDSIFVQLWGAQGGSGANGNSAAGVLGGAGGLGGYIEGYIAVTPGDVLNLFIGGQGATPTGGFNGGANGGTLNAGGGGGATDIRIGGTSEAERIIAAGGGGGGGRGGCEGSTGPAGAGGSGGAGGGGVGGNGLDSPTSGGVAGGGRGGNFAGIQGASGGAGAGCSGFLGSPGITATTGTGGSGGAGQNCCCFTYGSIPGGGGGGGGMLGGGGGGGGSAGTTGCSGNDKGAGGGGGGGSSAASPSVTGVVTSPGIWLGNGMITISY